MALWTWMLAFSLPRCQQWLHFPPYLSMSLSPSRLQKWLALWWASNTKVISLAANFTKVPGPWGVCSVWALEFQRISWKVGGCVLSQMQGAEISGCSIPCPSEDRMPKRGSIFTWMATILYLAVGCRRWLVEASASVWPLNPVLGAPWVGPLSLFYVSSERNSWGT